MTKPAFTPGPWVLHPTALHPAVRSTGTADTAPRRICTVGTMNGRQVDVTNACLISAAPDLYEALQGLLDAHAIPSTICKERPAYESAIAALKKATGETK